MLGLYDHSGMLRYAGPGDAECLAYAELFGLPEGSFSLQPLLADARPAPNSAGSPAEGCSN